MTEPTQGTIARGVAWVAAASSVIAVFDLVALVVILRCWVSSDEFGTVSLVVTAFAALQLIAQTGLPAAIVQRKDPGDDRLSTAFWFVIASGLTVYAAIWLVAPYVAAAYERPVLVPLFRVVGVMVVLRPTYAVHESLLKRELRFRDLSKIRILANAVELVVKLGTAFAGGGLWAFALGPLAREVTYAIATPLYVAWRPRALFTPRRLGADFRFGVRATGGELLFQLYSNLDYQVVAYSFGLSALGLYRAAYELVLEPVRVVSNVVTVVAFPAFARLRTDRDAIRAQFIAFSRQNLVVVLLVVGVIIVSAGEILTLVFGAEYAAAASTAQILAIVGALRSLGFLGPPLLDGVGRPDLSLRYQFTATVLLSTLFVIASHLGTTSFAIGVAWAVGYPVAFGVLWTMVLLHLELRIVTYLRAVVGIPLVIAVSVGGALLVHAALDTQSIVVRLVGSSVSLVGLALVLMSRFEGISPRSVVHALRR